MTPARLATIAAAQALVGLDGAALAAALCPAGIVGVAPEDVPAAVARLSTCELAAASLLRAVYVCPEPLPYVTAGAGAELAELVGGAPWHSLPGCGLRYPTLDAPPQPGDAVWYGSAPGHVEHVDACVVDAQQDGATLTYSAVAGGQPDGAGHFSAVALVSRTLTWTDKAWRHDATGREVLACVDADRMAALRGLREGT